MLKSGRKNILSMGLILLITMTTFYGCESTSLENENTSVSSDTIIGEQTENTIQNSTLLENKNEQKLTWNITNDPENIDPSLNLSSISVNIIGALFSGLTKLDNDGNAIPSIAESLPIISKNGLNYKFKIRDDAKWSDGKSVSSKDFIYSIKRSLTMKSSNYIFQLFNIKNAKSFYDGLVPFEEVGIKAENDLTLEITLENPTPYFLELLSNPIFMPLREDVISKSNNWTNSIETCISNGPFKLKEWTRYEKIVLTKNERFFNANDVKLDEITFLMIERKNDAVIAFKNNEIDFIENPPISEIKPLTDEGTYKSYPIIGTYYLLLNQSSKLESINPDSSKALKDKNVRKALSLAIDRQSIIDAITASGEKTALSIIPYGIKDDKNEEFNNKDYLMDNDIQEAKKLLSEAGYPNGENFPKLQYIYPLHNSDEINDNVAIAVQSMWKDNLGINVEIIGRNLDYIENAKSSNEYMITNQSQIGTYMDASVFLENFYSKSEQNYIGYNNPLFDEKLELSKKEIDAAKRIQLLKDCESMLMEDSAVIPIFFHTLSVAVKPYVKDLVILPTGAINFENIYIDRSIEN